MEAGPARPAARPRRACCSCSAFPRAPARLLSRHATAAGPACTGSHAAPLVWRPVAVAARRRPPPRRLQPRPRPRPAAAAASASPVRHGAPGAKSEGTACPSQTAPTPAPEAAANPEAATPADVLRCTSRVLEAAHWRRRRLRQGRTPCRSCQRRAAAVPATQAGVRARTAHCAASALHGSLQSGAEPRHQQPAWPRSTLKRQQRQKTLVPVPAADAEAADVGPARAGRLPPHLAPAEKCRCALRHQHGSLSTPTDGAAGCAVSRAWQLPGRLGLHVRAPALASTSTLRAWVHGGHATTCMPHAEHVRSLRPPMQAAQPPPLAC
eukprot:365083-Chlamydomonas_euryale.AAC.2